MAIDEAKRFLEEFKPGSELGEAVKAVAREEGEPLMAFYARAAADLGFEFEPDELESAYVELQDGIREEIKAVELSDDELDQMSVAGGWCWFDNLCSTAINYQKLNENCKHTYDPKENCITLDRCDMSSNKYSGPIGPDNEFGV